MENVCGSWVFKPIQDGSKKTELCNNLLTTECRLHHYIKSIYFYYNIVFPGSRLEKNSSAGTIIHILIGIELHLYKTKCKF